MTKRKFLIVNADDFGLTSGINKGIIETHQRGIVTSASLMVRGPAAEEAARLAQENPKLSVGLHFDVEEWRCSHGEWQLYYQVVDRADLPALRDELERQLGTFQHLLGRAPTHLDSHQHVHRTDPARTLLVDHAKQLNVPLRSYHPAITYHGGFYGQGDQGEPHPAGISLKGLTSTIKSLPTGWSEVGCHPGYVDGLDSVYLREREEELRVLCASAVKTAVETSGVELKSFRDFAS